MECVFNGSVSLTPVHPQWRCDFDDGVSLTPAKMEVSGEDADDDG